MGAKKAKPVKKVQKIAQPQETSLQTARSWAGKNYSLIIGISASILFASILVWGYISHERGEQANAQTAYGLIASRLQETPVDWEKLIPDLREFISRHKDTAPALNARIELAKACFETKRYEDAVKTGEEALKLAPSGSALRPLIMYQLGYAYEAAGKTDQAADTWMKIKEMKELEREADWNLARIFEAKKDFAKAAEMYRSAFMAPGDYPPPELIQHQIAGIGANETK